MKSIILGAFLLLFSACAGTKQVVDNPWEGIDLSDPSVGLPATKKVEIEIALPEQTEYKNPLVNFQFGKMMKVDNCNDHELIIGTFIPENNVFIIKTYGKIKSTQNKCSDNVLVEKFVSAKIGKFVTNGEKITIMLPEGYEVKYELTDFE